MKETVLRLERRATGNCHLITAGVALRAGLSKSGVMSLNRSGRWLLLARGVYAVAGRDGGPMQQAAADLLAAGEFAVLHRRSAAFALGLDLAWDGTVDLAVPLSGSGRGHVRRSIPPQHIVTVDGLRCTDTLQTLLDLACLVDDIEWERALEAGLRSTLVSVSDIEAALAAPSRKSRAGVARVRGVLARRRPGVPPTESLLETLFVQLARRVGVPDPERQVEIVTAGGFRVRLDFAWPDFGLWVELDGKGHDDQPFYDSRRQTAIAAATGWMCGRFTWREIVDNPRPTGRRLQALVEQARARTLPH